MIQLMATKFAKKKIEICFGFNSTYEKSTKILVLKSETFAGIQLRYDDINDLELS